MQRVHTSGQRRRTQVEETAFLPALERFHESLRARGYAQSTVSTYSQAASHFLFWAAEKNVSSESIASQDVSEFLDGHLSECRCPFGGTRTRHTVRASLRLLLRVLRNDSDRGDERQPDQIDCEVLRFDEYLSTTCGLRENTRIYRRRYVREFLTETFRGRPLGLSRLKAKDVVEFVGRRIGRYKPGSAQVVASALRSYFRFLTLRGVCDEGLIMAVPSVPDWKLAELPRVLTDDELSRLLDAFDRSTSTGCRDYAITRCLVDLALRAGEVSRLRLEDLDWRRGIIRIVAGKPRRDDELPLPESTGRALTAYLRQARSGSTSRAVFLRHRPPIGDGATSLIVRNAVVRAAARAGLSDVITGTRILRHTAATRMLRRGASLKEIADVLRHRSFDTTAIYTKVDLPRLQDVAMPWLED